MVPRACIAHELPQASVPRRPIKHPTCAVRLCILVSLRLRDFAIISRCPALPGCLPLIRRHRASNAPRRFSTHLIMSINNFHRLSDVQSSCGSIEVEELMIDRFDVIQGARVRDTPASCWSGARPCNEREGPSHIRQHQFHLQ